MNNRVFESGGRQHWKMETLREMAHDSKILDDLAEEYETRTEAYDCQVCSHITAQGIAMPTNHYESAMINRNARKVRSEITQKASEFGLSWKQVKSVMDRRK